MEEQKKYPYFVILFQFFILVVFTWFLVENVLQISWKNASVLILTMFLGFLMGVVLYLRKIREKTTSNSKEKIGKLKKRMCLGVLVFLDMIFILGALRFDLALWCRASMLFLSFICLVTIVVLIRKDSTGA